MIPRHPLSIIRTTCLCYNVMFVSCGLVVNCWEGADPLALLYVMFSCVFVTFPYGVLGQVWYLIVSIPFLLCSKEYCTQFTKTENEKFKSFVVPTLLKRRQSSTRTSTFTIQKAAVISCSDTLIVYSAPFCASQPISLHRNLNFWPT